MAGASCLFRTAIWRVAATFSDRAGTQNSHLGEYQLRQHPREACLTAAAALSPITGWSGPWTCSKCSLLVQ